MLILFVFTLIYCKLSLAELPTPLEQNLLQPGHLNEYYDIRDKCEWKPVGNLELAGDVSSAHNANDPACGELVKQVMSCEIEATFPEGKGFYRIIRMGPFSTFGGIDEYKCQYRMLPEFSRRDHKVDWMTRAVAGPVDPYTGRFFGYPPIHIHHAPAGPYQAYSSESVPVEVMRTMHWYSKSCWGGISAASQCQEDVGGTGCFARVLPIGYGIKRYNDLQPEPLNFAFHLQDVRDANSPALMSSMEYAVFYLTEPIKEIEEMKTLQEYRMFIGNAGDHLYETSYDTPVYQFATFYLATKMDFTGCNFHGHSLEGDEIWIVRGTQEDLGIPQELRRTPIYRKRQPGSGEEMANAVPIDPSRDSLESFKLRMEDALISSAQRKEEEIKNNPEEYKSAERRAEYGLFRATPSISHDNLKPFNPRSPPKSYTVPEILCKYYGTIDRVDDEMVRKDEEGFIDAYDRYGWVSKTQRHLRGIEKNESSDAFEEQDRSLLVDVSSLNSTSRRLAGLAGFQYDNWPVSPEEQLSRIHGTTTRGIYYRRIDSSQDRKEKKYQQCNAYKFEAGEYLTIVHFSEKRTKPKPDEFNYDEFVFLQHTIYGSQVHMPDFKEYL